MNNKIINENNNPPSIVISLDFEMRWGVHDKLGLNFDLYRENIENVWLVVPKLLKLFNDRNIRATWACVGALGCKDWDEYFMRAPIQPKYQNTSFKINSKYAELDPKGELHFAPELIQAIQNTPGQDLGTHTFSHIYLREPGITEEDVLNDLSAVSSLWEERFGVIPVSLVFPRNQYAFIPAIRKAGIKIWRGNETTWYFDCNESASNYLYIRALRILDSINPFIRAACPLEGDMSRSSLFLRLNLPDTLWKLHFSRIQRELKLLRSGEIFHVWWHPHNVGKDMTLRLARIEQFLDLVSKKCSNNLLTSKSMKDLIR
ncbi:polysaccharide deacetylase family protein [Candidatus Poribacteria bacterium]|nr:polysaccharide deacetylase family protein [Candidatus Poribacteria bacterium]